MDAFRHFVDRYQGRAPAHARVLTRIAADATQEALVSIASGSTASCIP